MTQSAWSLRPACVPKSLPRPAAGPVCQGLAVCNSASVRVQWRNFAVVHVYRSEGIHLHYDLCVLIFHFCRRKDTESTAFFSAHSLKQLFPWLCFIIRVSLWRRTRSFIQVSRPWEGRRDEARGAGMSAGVSSGYRLPGGERVVASGSISVRGLPWVWGNRCFCRGIVIIVTIWGGSESRKIPVSIYVSFNSGRPFLRAGITFRILSPQICVSVTNIMQTS